MSAQNAAPGDLSNRVVGQGAATLNLATAARGLYSVSSSSEITADYAYGSTLDHGRTVQTAGGGGTMFAYEPISDNLVGNGDAAMNGAGWQGMEGSFRQFQSQHVSSNPSQHTFILTAFADYSSEIRQFMQLPTPNSPMKLSFTYGLNAVSANTDEIQVFLNSVLLADLHPTSTAPQIFETEIDDPAFQNVSDPVLLFRVTSTAQFGDAVNVGNIILTAVPEPSTGCFAAITTAALFSRRRKRSSLNAA